MSWIPTPHIVLGRLFRIEEEDDSRLLDASEVFWLFCLHIINPNDFPKEMAEFKESVEFQKGTFTHPEIQRIMTEGFKNPDIAAQAVINKLDLVIENLYVYYEPDQSDFDFVRLYIYIHLEASRLIRLLKFGIYSEKVRESLDSAIKAYNWIFKSLDNNNSTLPWSDDYTSSLEAVASFLFMTQYLVLKSDSDYEDALTSLANSISHGHMAYLSYSIGKKKNAISELSRFKVISDLRYETPWMKDLDPQEIVNVFESLRKRGNLKDPKSLTGICDLLAYISSVMWIGLEEGYQVLDSQGEPWHPEDYWKHVSGWVEARLSQSEFIEVLGKRDEQMAQQRLISYFFGHELWQVLPEKTQQALVSADRDWFSGVEIRQEAVLNDLVIATQELLIEGLWKPLEKWLNSTKLRETYQRDYLHFKDKLASRKGPSTLRILADICKSSISQEYLTSIGKSPEDKKWFIRVLHKRIHRLHDKRNLAEHESGISWTRSELSEFYNSYIGIGEEGIIFRLGRILFQ